MNNIKKQPAHLTVLYAEHPQQVGDPFVEVRQWKLIGQDDTDLIVEHGQLNQDGELQTECQVMPFFMTVREVLKIVG